MPGRLRHLELSPSSYQPLVAVQDLDPRGRHGQYGTPQAVHLLAVEAAGTGQELRRIDQVARATLVHEHLDLGVRLQKRPGGARVIEMDVRQQHLTHVANRYPL